VIQHALPCSKLAALVLFLQGVLSPPTSQVQTKLSALRSHPHYVHIACPYAHAGRQERSGTRKEREMNILWLHQGLEVQRCGCRRYAWGAVACRSGNKQRQASAAAHQRWAEGQFLSESEHGCGQWPTLRVVLCCPLCPSLLPRPLSHCPLELLLCKRCRAGLSARWQHVRCLPPAYQQAKARAPACILSAGGYISRFVLLTKWEHKGRRGAAWKIKKGQ